MGDGEKAPLRLQFNPKVRLEFHGSTITSDAQIHHQKEKGHLVGASGKAGYDGKRSNQAITNEVQLLWVKGHCLSSTFRRRVRGGG